MHPMSPGEGKSYNDGDHSSSDRDDEEEQNEGNSGEDDVPFSKCC